MLVSNTPARRKDVQIDDILKTLGPVAIQALLEGRAAVVPLVLADAHLEAIGAMGGYDVDFNEGCADKDHRYWWDLAVQASRIDAVADQP